MSWCPQVWFPPIHPPTWTWVQRWQLTALGNRCSAPPQPTQLLPRALPPATPASSGSSQNSGSFYGHATLKVSYPIGSRKSKLRSLYFSSLLVPLALKDLSPEDSQNSAPQYLGNPRTQGPPARAAQASCFRPPTRLS